MSTGMIAVGCLLAGFLTALLVLDRLYRTAFKEFSDELHNQYLELLKRNGYTIKS